jgi:hypothetical protein
VSNISTTGMSVSEFAASITQKLDADKDGRISNSEFSGFLTQFLGALKTGTGSSPAMMSSLSGLTGTTSSLTGLTLATSRAKVGTLAGYDSTKLANENHRSAKYEIGRILQYHPNTPEGLKAALPEIQQLAPNARIVGSKGDKIDFGGWADSRGEVIGVIDVLEAAGLGGRAWQWLPV